MIDAEPNTPTNTLLLHTPTCVTPSGGAFGVCLCVTLLLCYMTVDVVVWGGKGNVSAFFKNSFIFLKISS